jgi:iron complex outermembrane receptor protein
MIPTPSLRRLFVSIVPTLVWPALVHAAGAPTTDQVVQLSAFEVTAANDRGYGTTNSLGATRMNISVLESPQVVVSLNEKFIEDSGLIEFEDVANYVAGVSRGSTKVAGTVTMRGTEIGGLGLTDGLREGLAGLTSYDMVGVSRFEFIKGPAGALYGSHAVGGVVNRVMKRPTDRPFTSMKISLDEMAGHHLGRVEVDTSNRVLGKRLGYRLAGAIQEGKAQGANRDDRQTLYSFLEYKVAPTAKSWVRAEVHKVDRTTPSHTFRAAAYDPARPTQRSLGLGVLPVTTVIAGPGNNTFKVTDLYLGEAGFQYDVAGWTLKIVGRGSFDKTNRQTFHGNNFDFISASGAVIGNQNNTLFENPNWVEIRTRGSTYDVDFSNGSLAGGFVDLAGRFELGPTNHQLLSYVSLVDTDGWAMQMRYNAASQNLINPRPLNLRVGMWQFRNLPADLTFNANTASSRSNASTLGYGFQDNVRLFGGRLLIAGGMGYQRATSNSQNYLAPANNIINRQNSQWSPSYGVVYRVTPEISLFGNHSETFRPRSGFDSLGNALRNGSGDSDEIGVKVNLWDGRLTGTFAVVKTTEDGFVVSTVINGFPASVQAGVATNEGWEFDLTAQPMAGLNLLAAFSDIDGKTESGAYFRNANAGFNWSLFARYDFQGAKLRGFSGSIGFRKVAERWGDGANTFILPGYETVSASIGFTVRPWRFQLQVENVLNRAYLVSAVNFSNIYFGDPRRLRLTTAYNF